MVRMSHDHFDGMPHFGYCAPHCSKGYKRWSEEEEGKWEMRASIERCRVREHWLGSDQLAAMGTGWRGKACGPSWSSWKRQSVWRCSKVNTSLFLFPFYHCTFHVSHCGREYSGAAGEWTEHRQFLPSIEFCAAKVSSFSFICKIFILNWIIWFWGLSLPDNLLCSSRGVQKYYHLVFLIASGEPHANARSAYLGYA